MKSAGVIVPFLQDYIDHYAWTPWGKARVAPAQFGNDAALLGVMPLVGAGVFSCTIDSLISLLEIRRIA